jgi:transcription elongation GreA/GreB family factor
MMDPEMAAVIKAETRRVNLAKAIAHAKEADRLIKAAQYSIVLAQLEGQTAAIEARGATAKLLDVLDKQAAEIWGPTPESEAAK